MADDKLPATLESVIAARIAPIIGEMIPEQTLRDTVKKRLDLFMAGELNQVIVKELTDRCMKIVKDELDGPGYGEMWDGQRQVVGPKLEELIRKLVPDLVAAAMNAPFASLLQQMKYQLQTLGR